MKSRSHLAAEEARGAVNQEDEADHMVSLLCLLVNQGEHFADKPDLQEVNAF